MGDTYDMIQQIRIFFHILDKFDAKLLLHTSVRIRIDSTFYCSLFQGNRARCLAFLIQVLVLFESPTSGAGGYALETVKKLQSYAYV